MSRALLGPDASLGDGDALEARLEALHRRCRDRWPGVEVDALTLMSGLRARLGALAELDALHVEDVFLAVGCAKGDPASLRALDGRLWPEVRRSLGRVVPDASFVEELMQRLRHHVLVGAGGAPRIGEFSGRGPLLHWLRAIATRDALKLQRRERRAATVANDALATAVPAGDVELEIIRSLHRDDFRGAFEAAFRALTPRERNLLRMHVLDALTIDQIGAFYRTHRTTAFRWLEAAREELARGIRQELGTRLRLTKQELESLMGLVRSNFDVSLRRLLAISTP